MEFEEKYPRQEPNTQRMSREKQHIPHPGGADYGALPADPDLLAVVEAWPTLPDAIKEGVLMLVRAHG